MDVINLATKRAQTQKYKGITLDQAHEILRLFYDPFHPMGAPTVADKMQIDYKIVVSVLDGRIWPQAHHKWIYLSS